MTDTLNSDPKKTVDSSGFPLQLRIASLIRSSVGWKFPLEEHPWRSSDGQSEGFIDLTTIDDSDLTSMVIECKRVQQTAWVFLIPDTSPDEKTTSRLWLSVYSTKWKTFNYNEFQFMPKSYTSKYCAIPGQDQGRRNSLERTSATLIDSVEALALQEGKLFEKSVSKSTSNFVRIYIPIIVTTAELKVASFDPQKISLKDGFIPNDAYTYIKTVPYIRFRKGLTSNIKALNQDTLHKLHVEMERTVFVVNAEHFDKFLKKCEPIDIGLIQQLLAP
jgi:hypothetical protein